MTNAKRIIAFLFLIVLASCIDPYKPDIKNYKSMLVVEGLITNENLSYNVNLKRTTTDNGVIPETVNDAVIYILDNNGIKTNLINCGSGCYKTDSTSFTGVIGKKYSLHILTSDHKEYKSDECPMFPVAEIDSLYYEKDEEISGTRGESFPGLKILLKSSYTDESDQFFRWTFEETWKFKIPFPPRYKCLMVLNPDTYLFQQIDDVKENCWKVYLSRSIITNSIPSSGGFIRKQQIQFIDPVKSERLSQEYSILVKQYSISAKEFSFWNNLKKAGEAGEDIFASTPYQVPGNIHNVNDAGESVPGYFEVSAVSRKRIFITATELYPLNLPQYKTDCVKIAKGPDDWPDPHNQPTFHEIYYNIMNSRDFVFIEPYYNPDKTLQKLVYATRACSMCESGNLTHKPDFWIDL